MREIVGAGQRDWLEGNLFQSYVTLELHPSGIMSDVTACQFRLSVPALAPCTFQQLYRQKHERMMTMPSIMCESKSQPNPAHKMAASQHLRQRLAPSRRDTTSPPCFPSPPPSAQAAQLVYTAPESHAQCASPPKTPTHLLRRHQEPSPAG